MKKEYIVNLQGKDYPTYPGILDEAHSQNLNSIHTELIQVPSVENNEVAIVKATVQLREKGSGITEVKTFEAYGDASPANVNSRIATALIRMAETRAKGRALRDAVNVGQTMLEELPQDEGKGTETHNSAPSTTEPRTAPNLAPQTPLTAGQQMREDMDKALDEKAVTTPYCPTHNKKPMKNGKYGFYCPTKVGDGWCKEKATMGLGATLNTEEPPF